MGSKLSTLLRQPYPLFLEFSKTFPVIVAVSVFIPIFIFVFKPFGLTDADLEQRALFFAGFGAVTFLLLSINLYILPRLLPRLFDEDRWTVGKEMLWISWNVFVCVTFSATYEFIQPDCPFTLPQLARGYLQGFVLSTIPVVIVVLLTYLSLLRSRLRRAESVNQKIGGMHSEADEETLRLRSDAGEIVKLVPADLLFIQSSDNYSTIVWSEDGEKRKKLLRSSLTRLEGQIGQQRIVRCHRSFIVNLARVYSVSGNANGYKLYLKGHPEPMPVARRYGKMVLGLLEEVD